MLKLWQESLQANDGVLHFGQNQRARAQRGLHVLAGHNGGLDRKGEGVKGGFNCLLIWVHIIPFGFWFEGSL
jgi:hypothetical protein